MLTEIVPKPHDEVNILNFIFMVFIKTKSKRKNVMTALVMTLLMIGGVMLESSLFQKEHSEDCSCLTVTSTQVRQQEAAMFGWGKCRNGEQTKRFALHITSEIS